MSQVALVSYAVGAALFFGLTTLLATSWRGGKPGLLMIFGSALSTLWCALLAVDAYSGEISRVNALTAENLRNGAWLAFLTTILGLATGTASRRFALMLVHGLWVGMFGIAVVKTLGWQVWPVTEISGKLVLLGQLAIALAGLVLIEQVYRNTPAESKWTIKYLCLGLGGLFAYDLVLYAHAYLFVKIEENLWSARGLANGLAVPLIALAARRNPQWSLDIFVSRQVVFYGGSLTAVGLYLIAMAGGGYYIRVYGGTWGGFVQIIFLYGAVMGLVALALSGEVRRRLKVFVSKHFYRNKYEYRDEWLRLNDTLASTVEEVSLKQRAIKAMAQIIESPGGLLLQKHEASLIIAQTWRMPAPENVVVPADGAFANCLSAQQWVADTAQAMPVPTEAGPLPAWIEEINESVLIVPLLEGEQLQGMIVLKRPPQPFSLTYEDIDLLRTVGRQIAGYLSQHALDQQLAESRQFEAYNRLTSFLMHDLKNLIAQQSMVVKNAARHKDNPEFIEDAIKTIDNSVKRMQRLLQQLKAGAVAEAPGPSDLVALLRDVAANWKGRCGLVLDIDENDVWVGAGSERLAMIFRHIVKNADDASTPGQSVRISLKVADERAVVTVADAGIGMSPEFVRDRLFKPFDSTKGSQGMGIGAYQVREFVRGLGGQAQVYSQPGEGTRFVITLPRLRKSG